MNAIRYFSLFCGIGGFDAGLAKVDRRIQPQGNGTRGEPEKEQLRRDELCFQRVAACDIDRQAREIFKRHWPESFSIEEPGFGDARLMAVSDLPEFDLLVAGFPCPSFSNAGKRLGFDDPRGKLFFEIVRVAREKRPRALLLENVPGLLFTEEGKNFQVVLEALDEVGYDVEWQCLNGKYFVPQNRERVFLVGHSREEPFPQVFPLGEGIGLPGAKAEGERGEEEGLSSSISTRQGRLRCGGETYCLDTNYGNQRSRGETYVMLPHGSYEGGIRTNDSLPALSESPDSRFLVSQPHDLNELTHGVSRPYRVYDPNNGLSVAIEGEAGGIGAKTGLYAIQLNIRNELSVKAEETNAINTLMQGKQAPRIFERGTIRRLTPLECERLMGFSDGWTSGLSDTARYRLLGNSVIVPLVTYIGEHLLKVLR